MAGVSLPRQVRAVLTMWPLLEQVLAFFVGMTDLPLAGGMVAVESRLPVPDAMGLWAMWRGFFKILRSRRECGWC